MYNYKTEPFKHQRQALREGAKFHNFAYFMEMGTGKTKVASIKPVHHGPQPNQIGFNRQENIKIISTKLK